MRAELMDRLEVFRVVFWLENTPNPATPCRASAAPITTEWIIIIVVVVFVVVVVVSAVVDTFGPFGCTKCWRKHDAIESFSLSPHDTSSDGRNQEPKVPSVIVDATFLHLFNSSIHNLNHEFLAKWRHKRRTKLNFAANPAANTTTKEKG